MWTHRPRSSASDCNWIPQACETGGEARGTDWNRAPESSTPRGQGTLKTERTEVQATMKAHWYVEKISGVDYLVNRKIARQVI